MNFFITAVERHYPKIRIGLEPQINGFFNIRIDLQPQIIQIPLVFEAKHRQKSFDRYVK
jgi:hypothetical protein